VAFSPDGQRVFKAAYDTSPRAWEVETVQDIIALKGHTGTTNVQAISTDGTPVMAGSADGTGRTW
jgi:WD40 repeat protein